jgi:hypothetical protein
MPARICIDTINKGELDRFIGHSEEETQPIPDRIGRPRRGVTGARARSSCAGEDSQASAPLQALGL